MFQCVLIVLGCFACFTSFTFVLACVVAGLGCDWPSWLFYVAFGVLGKSSCFKLLSLLLVCFHIVYSCLGSLKTF